MGDFINYCIYCVFAQGNAEGLSRPLDKQFGGVVRADGNGPCVELLAEVLAQRDLGEDAPITTLTARTDEYLDEFEANGLANLTVDM